MTEQILKNIYRIQVPLPENPLKSLNSYLVKNEGGRSLLIDTGFNRKECEDAMRAALKELGANMSQTDLFVTHLHSDHCGLISVLPEKGTKVYASVTDGGLINYETDEEYWDRLDELFIGYGFPRAQFGRNTDVHPGRKYANEEIVPFIYLEEGDELKVGEYKFECILTPGHTPGHMCLYDREKKILFSGDHVLGDITPNICIEVISGNPLKRYLDNLNKVNALEIDHILCSHREKIQDPHGRINELIEHHKHRLDEVKKILSDEWMNAYQVAEQMSWRISCRNWDDFPAPQKWFATGEAVAHLQYLFYEKEAMRREVDGVVCYKK